nr:unnamed protein product [Spirometra erinaceieuropaei]
MRQHTDGFAFRCSKCGTKRALRTASVFERSHLTLPKAIKAALTILEGSQLTCSIVIAIIQPAKAVHSLARGDSHSVNPNS